MKLSLIRLTPRVNPIKADTHWNEDLFVRVIRTQYRKSLEKLEERHEELFSRKYLPLSRLSRIERQIIRDEFHSSLSAVQ